MRSCPSKPLPNLKLDLTVNVRLVPSTEERRLPTGRIRVLGPRVHRLTCGLDWSAILRTWTPQKILIAYDFFACAPSRHRVQSC